ncbi:MAG: mitofilin family membrane protein [Pseudomonadota bacterium]
MARRSNSNRRGSTRKPVTIDLDAEPAPDQTMSGPADPPQAELVGFDEPTRRADVRPALADDEPSEPLDEVTPNEPTSEASAETLSATPPPATTTVVQKRGISALGGGIVGGALTLLGAAGLQWGGVLPSMAPSQPLELPAPVDITPLQREIAELRTQLSEVGSAATDIEQALPEELTAGISEAGEAAASAQAAATEAQTGLEQIQETVAALNSQVTLLESAISSGDAGENAGLEAITGRLETIEGNVETLSGEIENVATNVAEAAGSAASSDEAALSAAIAPLLSDTTSGLSTLQSDFDGLSGTVEGLTGQIAAVQTAQEETANTMNELSSRIDAAEETLSENAGGSAAIARAVAATSLKTAVDRGAPFMNELETFASIGGGEDTIASLREYAAGGVPTLAALTERAGGVANAIVAIGEGLDENASIADRLMSSARSLVSVRRTGEVEGDTPEAIAARIEADLKNGDLQAALNEWETLPGSAKNVSADFADAMRARLNADTLVQTILNNAMAGTASSSNDAAGQE